MKIDTERTLRLIKNIEKYKNDVFMDFVNSPAYDELVNQQHKNLDVLFDTCRKYNFRYIFIHTGELCGCEGITDQCGRPVIWQIVDELGISGGCGNSDQKQIRASALFPKDLYGGYDLNENRKLSNDEIIQLKFRHVVSRARW